MKSFEVGTRIRKEICQHFGASKVSLSHALAFKTNSFLAKTMRHHAYKLTIKELERIKEYCQDPSPKE